jgi:ABC-type transport system involved in multi-copper enzyme maturation permease subunit
VRQTSALLIDSYRELNAKKLFWITLILSCVVALAFLTLGIDDVGVKIFGVRTPLGLNTTVMPRPLFYRVLFFQFGVNLWLTWAATVLALISTSGIFPDLLSTGSIDLYLSKPISRLRLFLTKYFAGLLFVALQLVAFILCSLAVMKIRGGEWYPQIFWAIPIVLLFYSYLHCVSVFLGVLTRSTIAAVLMTILLWMVPLSVHAIEVSFLKDQIKDKIVVDRLTRKIEHPGFFERNKSQLESERAAAVSKLDNATWWETRFHWLMTPLPKTSETVQLLLRTLVSAVELKGSDYDSTPQDEPQPLFFGYTTDDARAQADAEKELRARPVSWVVGTSVMFEAVVILCGAWIFCRRDY